MNNYKAKQEARRDRLEQRASKASASASAARDSSLATLSRIEPGQPILVGHHSERRHRRDLERSDAAMRRSLAESEKAEELARRAAAVGTGDISSDDPEAVVKLRQELADEQASHARGLVINKAWCKALKTYDGDPKLAWVESARIKALYLSNAERAHYGHSVAVLPRVMLHKLVNTDGSSAKQRRIRTHIEELQTQHPTAKKADVRHDDLGLTIVDGAEDNRIALRFDSRPSKETCFMLCKHGWRWAPSRNACIRQRNAAGWTSVQRVVWELAGTDFDREGST
jgi:hypothetical protein